MKVRSPSFSVGIHYLPEVSYNFPLQEWPKNGKNPESIFCTSTWKHIFVYWLSCVKKYMATWHVLALMTLMQARAAGEGLHVKVYIKTHATAMCRRNAVKFPELFLTNRNRTNPGWVV